MSEMRGRIQYTIAIFIYFEQFLIDMIQFGFSTFILKYKAHLAKLKKLRTLPTMTKLDLQVVSDDEADEVDVESVDNEAGDNIIEPNNAIENVNDNNNVEDNVVENIDGNDNNVDDVSVEGGSGGGGGDIDDDNVNGELVPIPLKKRRVIAVKKTT